MLIVKLWYSQWAFRMTLRTEWETLLLFTVLLNQNKTINTNQKYTRSWYVTKKYYWSEFTEKQNKKYTPNKKNIPTKRDAKFKLV